ncbi:MAG TPA: hypothetical protein VFT55_13410, partial [Planctomycetota bacterium]|nr:hypothetical protein [Planctomycetota bacterium]
SLVKELRVVERAWLDADRLVHYPPRLDARLVVQSHGELCALELLAIGVRNLRLDGDRGDPVCYSGSVRRRVTRPIERTEFDFSLGASKFTCERLFVAERPDWHGQQARLDGEVPAPDAVPARDLGSDCRQCSACATPFDAAGRGELAWCPGCHRLTYVSAPA